MTALNVLKVFSYVKEKSILTKYKIDTEIPSIPSILELN